MPEQGGSSPCEINQAFLNSVKIGSMHGGSYLEVRIHPNMRAECLQRVHSSEFVLLNLKTRHRLQF